MDTRVMMPRGMRPDVKRTPAFGRGCVGGAAGITRAVDYLEALPNERALLVAVELYSLTLQHTVVSVANQIASGMFGYGGLQLSSQAGQLC
jgi:alkylresorcinol/alkylpyrone synthase